MHVHVRFKAYRVVTSDDSTPNIIEDVLDTEDSRWQEQDFINGYLPTGVAFRWLRMVCQSPDCDENDLICAVQGEKGDWNYLFSMEGDFVADTNEDSLYCEAHSMEFG